VGVSQSGKEELRRELNIALLSGLGIGSVIGSGVYALPGLIASVSGPSSILAVVLMGLITLVLMYIFAKLAKLYPRAGALYYFAKETLGDMPGFITGFSYYVSCFVGVAAIIYAFLLYLSYYVPGVAIGLTLTPLGIIIALTILAIVTAINIVGVKHGATLNFILTVLKIIPLIVFVAVALMRINVANFEPFAPFGFGGIGLAIAFGFWMFVGFESIVLVSEEVREPEKTIMRAAVITIAIVTAIYTLIMLSFYRVNKLGWVRASGKGLELLKQPKLTTSRC